MQTLIPNQLHVLTSANTFTTVNLNIKTSSSSVNQRDSFLVVVFWRWKPKIQNTKIFNLQLYKIEKQKIVTSEELEQQCFGSLEARLCGSRLKHLHKFQMACPDILFWRSWSPEDESCRLCSSSTTNTSNIHLSCETSPTCWTDISPHDESSWLVLPDFPHLNNFYLNFYEFLTDIHWSQTMCPVSLNFSHQVKTGIQISNILVRGQNLQN